MARSDTPVKVVLTASISLVASSALQGTATIARVAPEQQWKAVQASIERDAVTRENAGSNAGDRIAQTSPASPTPHPTPPPSPGRGFGWGASSAPQIGITGGGIDKRSSLRVVRPPSPTPVSNRPPIHVFTPPVPKIR